MTRKKTTPATPFWRPKEPSSTSASATASPIWTPKASPKASPKDKAAADCISTDDDDHPPKRANGRSQLKKKSGGAIARAGGADSSDDNDSAHRCVGAKQGLELLNMVRTFEERNGRGRGRGVIGRGAGKGIGRGRGEPESPSAARKLSEPTPVQSPARQRLSSGAAAFVPTFSGGSFDRGGHLHTLVHETFGECVHDIQTVVGLEHWATVYIRLTWPSNTQSQCCAIQVLLEALVGLGQSVLNVELSPDQTRLWLEYIPCDVDTICWDYIQQGMCPRTSCMWKHVVADTFVIVFMLSANTALSTAAPMFTPTASTGSSSLPLQEIPRRRDPPKRRTVTLPIRDKTLDTEPVQDGLPLRPTPARSVASPSSVVSDRPKLSCSLPGMEDGPPFLSTPTTPAPTLSQRLRSATRAWWADIEDDDDDDDVFI